MAALPPLKVNPFTLITEFQIWGVSDIIFFFFFFSILTYIVAVLIRSPNQNYQKTLSLLVLNSRTRQ